MKLYRAYYKVLSGCGESFEETTQYTSWFTTKEEAEKAIEYLQSSYAVHLSVREQMIQKKIEENPVIDKSAFDVDYLVLPIEIEETNYYDNYKDSNSVYIAIDK